ncbi:hypothetical protein D9615_008079 [Tricholomella constricta]|uniref:Uncharacterized protein n=1 Tax=Tricholomella constricta TaxID=117010 RepID=A0A8H5GVS4_9AGAR|nr:hypothetical protein D9615_008079 [Tricholomella constricta]
MAKPTMLQSLLGRPSQTYSFPQEKVYHSTKQDMLRIATETHGQEPPQTAVVRDDEKSNAVKPTHDVRATTDSKQLLITDTDEDDDDDDSDRDVFYTPNTSPRTSMASTIAPPLKPPSPPAVVPSTKTSFTHTNTSTASISSSALDAHSLFSIANSDSTRITSPVQSDTEQHTPRVKAKNGPPQVSNGHADQQWAKDVRWLVPTTVKATTTPKRRPSAKVDQRNTSQTRTKPNTPMSKSINKMTPSIMSSMTALLEEDELEDTPDMLHHPRSSVLISTTPRRSAPRSRMSSNPTPASNPSSKSKPTMGNTLHRRRSRSLGHGSSSHASTSSSHNTSSSTSTSLRTSPHKPSKYASSSADPYDRTSTSLPTFTPGDLPSHGTPGYTSLVLPRAPVPFSQTIHRPKGLFSKKDAHHAADLDGKVDLTLSGVAQTTMASVEVVRGLSGGASSSAPNTSPSKKLMGLFRRGSSSSPSKSASGPLSAFGPAAQSTRRATSEDRGLGKAREVIPEELDLPLGFTSYRTPPKYVPSGGVLVQVWAVGVDGVDWRMVFGGSNGSGGGGGGGGGPTRSNTYVASKSRGPAGTPPTTPKRSVSLRSTLGRFGGAQQRSDSSSPRSASGTQSPATPPGTSSQTAAAGVGYIPGRSFVGRVLECGWEVGEEAGRRGDWVVGLLDLKKCGALTEFIVVDRHRVHRAPYPRIQQDGLFLTAHSAIPEPSQSSSSRTGSDNTPGPSSSSKSSSYSSPSPSRNNSTRIFKARHSPSLALDHSSTQHHRAATPNLPVPLSLEELALLPICGIPAYRAVRTFVFAFSDGGAVGSSSSSGDLNYHEDVHSHHEKGRGRAKEALDGTRRRRALVLRGHDGAGALAVQMLVRRGWRVCVHVPFACLPYEAAAGVAEAEVEDGEGVERTRLGHEYLMRVVEERVRVWGGEEVVFDDGEEGEGEGEGERGPVVRVINRLCEDGDVFDAVLDTVGGKEVWEASERLLKSVGRAGAGSGNGNGNGSGKKEKEKTKRLGIGLKQFTTLVGDSPGRTIPSAGDNFKAGLRSLNFGVGDGKKLDGKVGYAWISHAQDVDWEGEDVRETLGAVLRTAIDEGIRPWVGENVDAIHERVIPFEKAPKAFVNGERGVLTDGGTLVVKVVG